MEQPGYLKKPLTTTRSMQIACRVCDKVFFDNKSLMYHFESHLDGESANPGQQGKTLAALQRSWSFQPNFSEFSRSSSERKKEASNVDFSGMKYCLLSWPFLTPLATLPNGLYSNIASLPVLNCMAPLTPYFDYLCNLSPWNLHPTMSHKTVTSPLAYPLVYSQGCMKRSGRGFRRFHPLKFRRQNGCQGRNGGYKRMLINQLEKPLSEEIVLSYDEENGKIPVKEIDLNLKL